jgi:hypothetical protein
MVCSSQLGRRLAPVKRWHVGVWYGMFSLKLGEDWHLSRDDILGSGMVCSSQVGRGLASFKRCLVGVWYGMFFSIRLRTGICQEMTC